MSSTCMITRRGGHGISNRNAFLKVCADPSCDITITNGSYSRTSLASKGFLRPSATVMEHYFMIPSTRLGTYTVTASMDYELSSGTETVTKNMTVSVTEVGKTYELLISAPNYILDPTFGLSYPLTSDSTATYSESTKTIVGGESSTTSVSAIIDGLSITGYLQLKLSITGWNSSHKWFLTLYDTEGDVIDTYESYGSSVTLSLDEERTIGKIGFTQKWKKITSIYFI